MVTFEANGKKLEVAVTWFEASTDCFQKIYLANPELDEPLKIFAGMTGVPYTSLAASDAEDLEAALYQATAFVFNERQPFRKAPLPETFRIQDRIVKIPQRLGRCTLAQNQKARQLGAAAEKAGHCMETLISKFVAIYLQPLVDSADFDYERAQLLEQDILKRPIAETYPIGNFYFGKLKNFGGVGFPYLPRRLTTWLRPSPKLPTLRILTPGAT